MRYLLVLIVLLLATPAWAQPTFDTKVDSGDNANLRDWTVGSASISWTHTTTGSNRSLCVGGLNAGATGISGVTYNGIALTQKVHLNYNGVFFIELWCLAGPASGSNTVAVTFSSSTGFEVFSVSHTGVDQSTPYGTAVTNSATAGSVSVSATSAVGELVIDVSATNDAGSGAPNCTTQVPAPGGSQTQRVARCDSTNARSSGSSEAAGAASVNMSWSIASGSTAWGIGALPLKPVASTPACSGTSPNLVATTWDSLDACLTAASSIVCDTITITPGSYATTTTMSTAKCVNIRGYGVTVTDNSTGGDPDGGGGPPLLTFTESTVGSTSIKGIVFLQGTGVHLGGNGAIIKFNYADGGKPVLINGNTFTQRTSGNAIAAATNRGVIWNNLFTGTLTYLVVPGDNCFNNTSALRHYASGLTTSWTSPSTMGILDKTGTSNLYFENNTVRYMAESMDSNIYARTVYRNNTITNAAVTLHGDSSVSSRQVEFYNNTIIYDGQNWDSCGGVPQNVNGFIEARGGTLVVHGNVIPQINPATWGVKPEVAFHLQMIRRAVGAYPCWGTTTVPDSYPAPWQFGFGYTNGGTQAGTTGVFMDSDPVYLWNNTGAGNYNSPEVADYSPNECGGGAPTIADFIQSGRDYFLSTAKPNYVPFPYPHPLTSPPTISGTGLHRGRGKVRTQ